jgi:hypothetical protein
VECCLRQLHFGLNPREFDDGAARGPRPLARVLKQGRLADPCFAADHESAALTRADRLDYLIERLALGSAL